ncbi:Cleavage and polyadenylation specificity factor subunit 2 [Pleurostoma richardsiae]|uniref:Cleavage and polyadenylation specificity factor subunit 2 n=1 Tax=Pleurostoma richardsiae TaxID=41990 RepID=A0AA38VR35_9PEZI|nr:Cleavage and polyadenylation specificity factor subunit 2 [Pleurostoma richardsiae]
MFTFCPLQGALSESTASQSLLELDGGVKVLIDVGWDESFDVEKLKELEKQVPTLSLILLTHATVSHLAAFAHCCKNFPLFTRVPVYATRPVIDLGRTLLQDLYTSTPAAATTITPTSLAETSFAYSQAPSTEHNFLRQPPSTEEIARYFSLIQPLKYSQPHQPLPSPFSPPLNGLTITAYNSGHTLGGTIWHIQHGLESIVYAVDWNQARENVFAGAAWLGGGHGGGEVIEQLRKPTALVCSSRTPASLSRARRDDQLLDNIRSCIAKGGTVLIPIDSSARVLELAYLLEHAWRADAAKGNESDAGLAKAKLYLAGRSISSTMRHARSMLEWMDESIVREFEAVAEGTKRANGDGTKGKAAGPLDFRYLRLLERKAQIEKILSQEAADTNANMGRVILASDTSLEWGFSKEVLRTIASDSRNLVVLTEKPNFGSPQEPSIARTLWNWWKERRDGVAGEQGSNGESLEQVYAGGRELEIRDAKREELAGNELTLYQQWLATQRQLQATLQGGGATTMEAAGDAVDEASSETTTESEESDDEQQGRALNVSTTMGQASRKKVVLKDEDLGVNIVLKKKGVYDFDVRGKKGRDRMFPVPIRRKRNDEFGELIRPEDFLRAEEREETDGQDGGRGGAKGAGEEGLGKKRKWDDIGANKRSMSGSNKRPQLSRLVSDDLDAILVPDGSAVADELDDVEDGEEEQQPALGPSKLVVSREIVTVNLRVAYVEFSGLHDRRSLNMLIPLVQPRKLILISGGEEETLALAADCKKLLGGATDDSGHGSSSAVDVYTPAAGAAVDASVDTNAWIVKLADPLVRRLKWQNVRGLGIVTVTALLVATEAADKGGRPAVLAGDEEGANKRAKTEADNGGDDERDAKPASPAGADDVPVVPTLDVLPSAMASATRSAAQPLHVGDLRLADLRRAMQAGGHAAEFRGEGTLVIDGAVAVRKTATGRIELESISLPAEGGPAAAQQQQGGTFYAVKRMIYDGLAVVAGA